MLIHRFLAIFVTLSTLSVLLYHVNNTVLAVPLPSFVDPFTSSQSLPSNVENEICNDGTDNDRNGLVDENCGSDSESITKLVEGISRGEISTTSSLPTAENSVNEQLPEQEICKDNQDNDGNGIVDEMCEISPTPNTEGSSPPVSDNGGGANPTNEEKTDKFGIKMLYPSKPDGEQWYIRADHPEKDPQFRPQVSLSKNSDGSFKVTEGKIRMGVRPSTGAAILKK